MRLWEAVCVKSRMACISSSSSFSSSPFLSFTTSKSYLGRRKKGFLSLMADSHKFVLNMSSIDWPCRMNTIKETALSASHLGGEDGGIKRGEDGRIEGGNRVGKV